MAGPCRLNLLEAIEEDRVSNPEGLALSLSPLPKEKRSKSAAVISTVLNIAVLFLFLYLSRHIAQQVTQPNYSQMTLIQLPAAPVRPIKVRIPKIKVSPATKIQVKISPPAPLPQQVRQESRPLQVAASTRKISTENAPAPKQVLAKVETRLPGIELKPSAVQPVKPFRNVIGASGDADAARRAAAGRAGFTSGSQIAGSNGNGSGTVARAGFVSGLPGGGSNKNGNDVGRTSFGKGSSGGSGQGVQAEMVPAVITSVPQPGYTPSARAKGIQGDVVLRVRLTRDGSVEVLGVVQSLDPGLDKQAIQAVARIQFRPAVRNGQPVDQVTNVRIQFQLA